ncbi:DUF2254 family protein [Chromobacterium amazonense]|uniref:DUF2254 family protein n=1 Tax=Chromobacterium amazonense TaxID=1382803 RepID=UPI000D0464F2|nr:DUF2254 family protein [Chromobacterium amazonense]
MPLPASSDREYQYSVDQAEAAPISTTRRAKQISCASCPSRSDPQVAQVMLSAIATSIMTVASILFAILLMSLTLASMQFSPRIIVSFSRDKVTQRTLGIFPGALAYCIAAETEQAMSRMRGRLDALQTLAA